MSAIWCPPRKRILVRAVQGAVDPMSGARYGYTQTTRGHREAPALVEGEDFPRVSRLPSLGGQRAAI